jgi:hypothetical protein
VRSIHKGRALDLFAGPISCKDCAGSFSREDMFWVNKTSPTGQCRACRRIARKKWYERNTDKAKAYSTRWKRDNRDRWHDSLRKSKYGLQPGEYARMLNAQGGLCAICRTPHQASLHVDHDHADGRIRGLLCDLCNRGLGYFNDDPRLMLAAASYLSGGEA